MAVWAAASLIGSTISLHMILENHLFIPLRRSTNVSDFVSKYSWLRPPLMAFSNC